MKKPATKRPAPKTRMGMTKQHEKMESAGFEMAEESAMPMRAKKK